MKKINFISMALCIFAIIFLASISHADLNLLGQGTSVHGTYNLIYDTDLDITWYDFTNAGDTWQIHMDWASALSLNFGGITYSDWRLPTAVDSPPYTYGSDGTTSGGYNITSSEMGHLFYTELGNIGYFDIFHNTTSCYPTVYPYSTEGCLSNTGDFHNLQKTYYWTGTESSINTTHAWDFQFNAGDQYMYDKNGYDFYRSIAVMNGMAVVPEPISSLLFITGGAFIAGRHYFKKKDRT